MCARRRQGVVRDFVAGAGRYVVEVQGAARQKSVTVRVKPDNCNVVLPAS